MVGLSAGEKYFIQGGIAQDLRSDGRKRLTYRPISVETGVIPQVKHTHRNQFIFSFASVLAVICWLAKENFFSFIFIFLISVCKY